MLGRIVIGVVKGYRLLVSPWTPAACRYTPTCSAYAIEAVERYGAMRGAWFAIRRIGRCHPWGGAGYDPVPHAHEGGAGSIASRGVGGAADSVRPGGSTSP